MKRFVHLLAAGLLFACLPACPRPSGPTPASSPAEDVSYPLPDFSLTERDGRTVTRSDLLGKVWVASFVFTHCSGPCPQVSGTMARLQKELPPEPDLRLVTITVDPKRDTPEVLARYAKSFAADPERWLFLTGGERPVHHLLADGFKVGVARSAEAKPKPGEEIDHSTRLAVVDRRGTVRGFFQAVRGDASDADFEANIARLKQKVEALLREQP